MKLHVKDLLHKTFYCKGIYVVGDDLDTDNQYFQTVVKIIITKNKYVLYKMVSIEGKKTNWLCGSEDVFEVEFPETRPDLFL